MSGIIDRLTGRIRREDRCREAEAKEREHREREERERFKAARERVCDQYGLLPHRIRTWEDLGKWEGYGRDLSGLYGSRPVSRGVSLDEVHDLQVKNGILPRELVERWRGQKRRRHDLSQLREDLRYVREVGYDPDELYGKYAWERENKELQVWARRRPQLERELDSLEVAARIAGYELEPEQQEMIEALRELREAEAEARRRRAEEERDRDDGPDLEPF